MLQSSQKISQLKKQESDFPFQLSLTNHTLRNMFTGDPALPLIGKYNRNEYRFLDVVSVVSLDLEYNQRFTSQGQNINLPQDVINALLQIPEVIPQNSKNNNNKKQSKKQNKKSTKKQTKITQYFQEEKQDQEQQVEDNQEVPLTNNNKNGQFNPFHYQFRKNIKFFWTINVARNAQIIDALDRDPSISYVTHNMVFENIDFQFQKRLVNHLPITVAKSKNLYEWEDQSVGVSFDAFRSEYLSVHLGGQSLCFSPNNMKIGVGKEDIAELWTIILRENNTHYVFLHWIILDTGMSTYAKDVCQKSQTIGELVKALDMFDTQEVRQVFEL